MKSLIKIPTRKPHAYAEYQAMRDFLKGRDTFDTEELSRYLNISLDRKVAVKRVRVLIGILKSRKKAIIPIGDRAVKGKVQKYKVLNDNIEVTPPNSMKTERIKPPTKEARIKPEIVEKKMLTLADVERIGEMDLAFIGYTIRTEMEILSRKLIHSEEMRAKVSEHYEKVKKENSLIQLRAENEHTTMLKQITSLKEGNNDLKKTIGSLNNTIKSRNAIIRETRDELDGLRKRFGNTTDSKGFKLGEVAKFTNGRPSHLKG